MTVEIGNENNVVTGEVQTPVERIHLFTTHQAVCDFATTFNIQNYNVRYGQTATGKYVQKGRVVALQGLALLRTP